jgi:lipoprotein-anchoring transpeptidase ErfK/SrfK
MDLFNHLRKHTLTNKNTLLILLSVTAASIVVGCFILFYTLPYKKSKGSLSLVVVKTNITLSNNIHLTITNKEITSTNSLQIFKSNSQSNYPDINKSISRHPTNVAEIQIALARLGLSPGPIDGVPGRQTTQAIKALEYKIKLSKNNSDTSSPLSHLTINNPIYVDYEVTPEDLKRLTKNGSTWLEKAQQSRLDYESILELVSEKAKSSKSFIVKLNPKINWRNITPGTKLKIPYVPDPIITSKVSFIRISLSNKTLEAFDAFTNLLVHFPCSIAAKPEKRPVGTLIVKSIIKNPYYVFDPDNFQESEEAQYLADKINQLILPPGPNNPVGLVWIALNKPGYGIHGSPEPELIGKTESHGCFRLANWDACVLANIIEPGIVVIVEK